MYADDVTIYHKVNNAKDYNNFLKDFAAVQEWAHKRQININVDKCKVLHFGDKNENKTYYLNNVKIVSSKCEKYLEYSLIRIVILNNIFLILLKKLY